MRRELKLGRFSVQLRSGDDAALQSKDIPPAATVRTWEFGDQAADLTDQGEGEALTAEQRVEAASERKWNRRELWIGAPLVLAVAVARLLDAGIWLWAALAAAFLFLGVSALLRRRERRSSDLEGRSA